MAVRIDLNANGTVARAGIALTNVGSTPIEAVEAQKFLVGKAPDEKIFLETAKLASKAATPSVDRRGSVEYKREMVRVLCTRALQAALGRART